MPQTPFSPITPAQLQWEEHVPVADHYDDPYYSRHDGSAESQYVFLDGNNLTQRFSELAPHSQFVIGETGFGTGLNCLLAAASFLQHACESTQLHLVSVEKHPLHKHDLETALAQRPHLQHLCAPLLDQYPQPIPGFHHIRLHPRISLTLLYGDASAVLPLFHYPVDAWFLDGFAPSRNPDMWQATLFEQLARLSHAGTTLATFTAAGFVRRGLESAGFRVSKCKGFGHKRHMTTGAFTASPSTEDSATPTVSKASNSTHIIVVGAGLAGATTARALAERGCTVSVFDPKGIATEASGNLAGVVYSTPSPHLTAQNRFYLQSYHHALGWLHTHGFPAEGQGALNGVTQHFVNDKQAEKLRQASTSGVWPHSMFRLVEPNAALLCGGGYLRPAHWCAHLLDHANIHVHEHAVEEIHEGTPARVTLANGEQHNAAAVVLCTAFHSRKQSGLHWLPLKHIRGQVSYCRATEQSVQWTQAQCHGGYLTPALDGLHCVGATFDLHNDDAHAKPEDDAANLAQLKQYLPNAWQELGAEHIDVVSQRVAFRCQSTDFLPLCGPWPLASANPHRHATGLYLNIAHGSRGITGTPLCADLLADVILGRPLPVDQELVDALAPDRFIVRQRRKQPGWTP